MSSWASVLSLFDLPLGLAASDPLQPSQRSPGTRRPQHFPGVAQRRGQKAEGTLAAHLPEGGSARAAGLLCPLEGSGPLPGARDPPAET